jgi:hypothetical protein
MSSALAKVRDIVRRDVEEMAGKDTGPKGGFTLPHMYPEHASAVRPSRAVDGMSSFMNEPHSWRASRN